MKRSSSNVEFSDRGIVPPDREVHRLDRSRPASGFLDPLPRESVSVSPRPDLPGYRFLRRLGAGGQGRVWQANRIADGRRVAVKLIDADHLADPQARARFELSYETLRLVEHPGIVRGIDRGELPGGVLWYAAEYVSGLPLMQYIDSLDARGLRRGTGNGCPTPFRVPIDRDPGPRTARLLGWGTERYRSPTAGFPLRPVLELFVRVCDAVEAAHRVGVIHRDLKPSNIIVAEENAETPNPGAPGPNAETATGDSKLQHVEAAESHDSPLTPDQSRDRSRPGRDPTPKLIDFGLAKLSNFKSEISDRAAVTLTGQFLGSPAYASPEQVEGRPGLIDVRTDVYAIGVMLYQALTGEYPYAVDGPLASVFDRIRYAPPVPPRTLVTYVDADLQAVVLKALAKERERRYQTAGELRDDLERYLGGQTVRAKGDGLGYTLVKLVRRHKAAAAALAALVGLSIVYAATMTVLYRRSTRAESDARQKFQMAVDALSFAVDRIDEDLEHVPGAATTRARLLDETLGRMTTLLSEVRDDPALLAEYAQTLTRKGDLLLRNGDLDGTERLRREALAIRERLAAADPENLSYQEALAVNFVLLGDVAVERGDPHAAQSAYLAAHPTFERLAARFPEGERYQERLAYSFERLGVKAAEAGDAALSLDYGRRRLAIAEELAQACPKNTQHLYGLCCAHHLLTGPLRELGYTAEAADHALLAAEAARRLIMLDPHNEQFARQFIVTHLPDVFMGSADGRPPNALARIEAAAQVAESLLAAEPENPLFQGMTAACYARMADAAALQGDLEGVAVCWDRMLELDERQAVLKPTNRESQLAHCQTVIRMVQVFRSLGEQSRANPHAPAPDFHRLAALVEQAIGPSEESSPLCEQAHQLWAETRP